MTGQAAMRHLKIAQKFLMIVGLFGLAALLVPSYVSNQKVAVSQSYGTLVERDALGALAMSEASRNMQAMRAAIGDILMSQTPETASEARAEFKRTQSAMAINLDRAVSAMPGNAEIPKLKTQMLTALQTACARPMMMGAQAKDIAAVQESQRVYMAECRPAIDALSARIGEVVKALQDSATQGSRTLKQQAESSLQTVWIATLAMVATTIALGASTVQRFIVRPLMGLARGMGRIAEGDLSEQIDGQDRRDELGAMARAVAVLQTNALRLRELEETRAEAARIERQRAEEMAAATQGLAEGLRRMSQGDFAVELTESYAAEFEPLRSDFNSVARSLRESMAKVAHAAARIEDGTRMMRDSAAELSRRTEGQAASIEEQSAALTQITANVRDASERSSEAKKEAERAAGFAQTSENVVASAFSAMQRIESSSAEIGTISGLIDEISFQTNLLALNASVEAARAGDAGRGFVVVAQEVRQLAQRSARAAQEIKELIKKSEEEVKGGVSLVLSAGEAMRQIGQQVHLVNSKLDLIAQSARDQALALAEISTAVGQSDHATQQNAAMSEETLAAASTLSAESDALRAMLSAFRLGGDGMGPMLRALAGGRSGSVAAMGGM